MSEPSLPGMLDGLRVIEVCDETADYAKSKDYRPYRPAGLPAKIVAVANFKGGVGKTSTAAAPRDVGGTRRLPGAGGLALMGLGAEVVKVEAPLGPAAGSGRLRTIIPTPRDRSISGPPTAASARRLSDLVASADILLDASGGAANRALGIDRAALLSAFPPLIVARLTAFGDEGPWKDYKDFDLVHLALGGVMMNCGYGCRSDGSLRHATDRAADLARLPHRRRATRDRHPRRACRATIQRARPGGLGRHT